MKNIFTLFSLTLLLGVNSSLFAQESIVISEDESSNYLDRHPIYDYEELQLNATDTIPDFESKANKLKISGTIYLSDGVTPAKDVILFIEQADEQGDFDLRTKDDKRYAHHRGWIKTNADGQYTFYTFLPGNDRRYNQLQQLFPSIKEPSKSAYDIESFLFEEDPLLTKLCRKKINKKGDPTRILKPKKIDGVLVVEKDIILSSGNEASK